MTRTLSYQSAKRFYDRFGAKQDSQGFYEDAAVQNLVDHSDFSRARSVIEFGCGTGRFALRLMTRELPSDARYLGLDISDTMVGLASAKLDPYKGRAEVRLSDGRIILPVADASCDRVVSTYVTDLLSEEDIDRFLAESSRALEPGGRLCVVGLTHGAGVGRAVSGIWSVIHAMRPSLVGGCRPVRLAPRLDDRVWSTSHVALVRTWGISSEVVVARRTADSS